MEIRTHECRQVDLAWQRRCHFYFAVYDGDVAAMTEWYRSAIVFLDERLSYLQPNAQPPWMHYIDVAFRRPAAIKFLGEHGANFLVEGQNYQDNFWEQFTSYLGHQRINNQIGEVTALIQAVKDLKLSDYNFTFFGTRIGRIKTNILTAIAAGASSDTIEKSAMLRVLIHDVSSELGIPLGLRNAEGKNFEDILMF
jgi:hypothetical protein